MPYLPDDLFWKTESDCKASSVAAFLSFVTQFSLIGSELWFLVLTVDLHLASTNPFTSYKLNAQRYNLLVYSGSLGTALILLLLGNEVYGRSSDATCWIQVYPTSRLILTSLLIQIYLSAGHETRRRIDWENKSSKNIFVLYLDGHDLWILLVRGALCVSTPSQGTIRDIAHPTLCCETRTNVCSGVHFLLAISSSLQFSWCCRIRCKCDMFYACIHLTMQLVDTNTMAICCCFHFLTTSTPNFLFILGSLVYLLGNLHRVLTKPFGRAMPPFCQLEAYSLDSYCSVPTGLRFARTCTTSTGWGLPQTDWCRIWCRKTYHFVRIWILHSEQR